MKTIQKVLAAGILVACAQTVAAQYPTIPDSVKQRGKMQEAQFERLSDEAWERALPIILDEAQKGRSEERRVGKEG